MKRTPMTRKTPIKRKTPVKKVNPKRRKQNHARAYGAKRAFVAALPCLVCGYTPCEAAHVGNGGMSKKSGSENLVPLCGPHLLPSPGAYGFDEGHHAESHRGIKTFQRQYGLDLKAEAARIEAAWQAHHEREGDECPE